MIKHLSHKIGVLLDPRFWFRNRRVCQVESGELKAEITDFTIESNGHFTVWTENWPYAYGYLREPDLTGRKLPRRKTAIRLRKLENKLLIKEFTDWADNEHK